MVEVVVVEVEVETVEEEVVVGVVAEVQKDQETRRRPHQEKTNPEKRSLIMKHYIGVENAASG